MTSLTLNFIRHMIDLQWNVKVKDILPDSTSKEENNPLEVCEKTIRSSPFRVKSIEDLIFHCELTSKLNVLIKGRSGGSYQLIYVFAIVKDRAFSVKKSDSLKFLDKLKLKHLDSAEEVAFHCLVLVKLPVVQRTSADSNLADINERLPAEELVVVDLEVIQQFVPCKFDGEIPEFTIDKAKEFISKEGTNGILKVLAMEYLAKSIKAENVADILKIAIDQNLKVLQKQCSDFLKKCTILSVQNDSLSLSSETIMIGVKTIDCSLLSNKEIYCYYQVA
ncbi:unnamed protein product [Larinioides sclopetarius]|uniref:MATH domain-containing protein n=1 Tax=Larinioides sclopetarius TaxID=280406 RepID=A0AAV2AFY9_9ARAC